MNLREIARTFYILTDNLRFFCGFSVNLRAIDRFLRDLRYIPRKICCREMPRDLLIAITHYGVRKITVIFYSVGLHYFSSYNC